jgi:hypothetical protein
MRFVIAGSNEWLDGTSVRIAMTLRNQSATTANPPVAKSMTALTPSPASMFQRLRVYASGGTLVEDIPYYGRTVNMLENLLSTGKKRNDAAEGFRLALPDPPNTFLTLSDDPSVIDAGGTRKILMQVHSGLLNQAKFLPLPFMGALVLELDVVSDPAEAFIKNAHNDVTKWQLEDCYLLADTITLDSELQNQYFQAVLSGKNLPLSFSSFHTHMQGNPSQSDAITMLVTRGFSRAKTLFLTLFKPPEATDPITDPFWKRANHFYHPHSSYAYVASRDVLSYYIQI